MNTGSRGARKILLINILIRTNAHDIRLVYRSILLEHLLQLYMLSDRS